MRGQFENYFKQRKGLALAVILLCASIFVFIMPRIFSNLDASGKKTYWITFLFSFGILMYFLFGPKQKRKLLLQKNKPRVSSKGYQALQDEIANCTDALHKHRIWWGYGPLVVGWAVLLIGRWSQHPLYSHAIFALPVFALAFLAATKFVEEDNALDVRIAESILKGIQLERKKGLNSLYFQDLANSYTGLNMWIFGFIRVSPSLMILFSLFNAGPLSLLINYLSQFVDSKTFLYLIINSSAGLLLGMIGLFYGKMACQPYRWLLWKLQTVKQA